MAGGVIGTGTPRVKISGRPDVDPNQASSWELQAPSRAAVPEVYSSATSSCLLYVLAVRSFAVCPFIHQCLHIARAVMLSLGELVTFLFVTCCDARAVIILTCREGPWPVAKSHSRDALLTPPCHSPWAGIIGTAGLSVCQVSVPACRIWYALTRRSCS